MQILVTHLTRMHRGSICVAGPRLDSPGQRAGRALGRPFAALARELLGPAPAPTTGSRHVRPVAFDRLSTRLLAVHGGPFALGAVVDLGPTTPVGKAPEIEDHRFEPRGARRRRTVTPADFWARLLDEARPRLAEIFGPALHARGGTAAVEAGGGLASLGCLRPTDRPEIYLRARPDRPAQVRLRLSDGALTLDVAVTDIRLYGDDHATPDAALIHWAAHRLRAAPSILISVGLSRPYSPDPESPPVHWFQVNNLHFEDDPLWRAD